MSIVTKRKIEPEITHVWENYCAEIMLEYTQSTDEGLDIEQYENLFKAVSELSFGEVRTKTANILFDAVTNAKVKDGYKYNEPSSLEEIKALRRPYKLSDKKLDESKVFDKIHGAWIGRIAGCFLGKATEGIKSDELCEFLKRTDNYPLHRYIRLSDCTEENVRGMKHNLLWESAFPDKVNYMPYDDDTNYMVLAMILVEKYGKDFTPDNVADVWLRYQPKDAYCTAERRAFINFVAGFRPPYSALYKNPYREWIGAQIRGDFFGYINPGNTEKAAEMGWRDASISHVKNGIYGEMFVCAMIASAFLTDSIEEVILSGLGEIPTSSRLYESVMTVLNMYKSGKTSEEVFSHIHAVWDEYSAHHWCHTISNAMIVTASLLYGNGDYAKSICLAVQTGFDTDCNGATVGSILGVIGGYSSISDEWKGPLCDSLETTIFGYERVKISDCAKKTYDMITM